MTVSNFSIAFLRGRSISIKEEVVDKISIKAIPENKIDIYNKSLSVSQCQRMSLKKTGKNIIRVLQYIIILVFFIHI